MSSNIVKLAERNASLWSMRQRSHHPPPKGGATAEALSDTEPEASAAITLRTSEPPRSGIRHRKPDQT